jgi:hypothetical protein
VVNPGVRVAWIKSVRIGTAKTGETNGKDWKRSNLNVLEAVWIREFTKQQKGAALIHWCPIFGSEEIVYRSFGTRKRGAIGLEERPSKRPVVRRSWGRQLNQAGRGEE